MWRRNTGADSFAVAGSKVPVKVALWMLVLATAWSGALHVNGDRLFTSPVARASSVRATAVALQPLAAQLSRLIDALDYVGAPLSSADRQSLDRAIRAADEVGATDDIQRILDSSCLFNVEIDFENRVRVTRGSARPELVQSGWRTFLIKVRNEAGIRASLMIESPQAKPVFLRADWKTEPPRELVTPQDIANRWLELNLYTKPPLTEVLSGSDIEYRIVQLYSRDAGEREATFRLKVGQSTPDTALGSEISIVFKCRPARDLRLRVLDENGEPTTASFVIRDANGYVYPSPTKRLAPDFGFQYQIYRADGEHVTLPVGQYEVMYTRGPEYIRQQQTLTVADVTATDGTNGATADGTRLSATFQLRRWVDPAKFGWYSGDHHIHAAGCTHYESPTIGVLPKDMIAHIIGEGLAVGAVLTWAPGYNFQKQFFEGKDHQLSTKRQLMHYDIEVSGFPSSHAGHLVLLGLKDQEYPGAHAIADWPTWNLPILRWAKTQGAVVGYAHSAYGLEVTSTELPNYEMPKFDGIGANEYIVDVTHDAVDFISTVDTPAISELNIWYHTLNVGFRTLIAGETDFPCIYGRRLGIGRSYVKLQDALTYFAWIHGIRAGSSYVGDGKSHLMEFRANGHLVGADNGEIHLDKPSLVHLTVRAVARFEKILDLAKGLPDWDLDHARIGDTNQVPVEAIVNGKPAAKRLLEADGTPQDLTFDLPIDRSSWIALRILPSSHTNPVFAIVDSKPIRASRASAEWCLAAVDQCWTQKVPKIAPLERSAAAEAYQHARDVYRQRAAESQP